MAEVDHARFVQLLTARIPAVAEDIDECARGLLHLEMGALCRATQAAVSAEDIPSVRNYFAFVAEFYRRATPEVKNAVHVSYLEHLGFEGRHGKRINARGLLSPALQSALKGLEAYWAELAKRGRA